MVGDGSLTLQEFAMSESLPLATIHDAVLQFLQGRDDLAIYGAQAVNAYVEPPRMTQDIDVIAIDAASLAEEIRVHLVATFVIAVRVREVASGVGFRVYQVRKPKNRHLVDVRQETSLPSCQLIGGLKVLTPAELVARKIISMVSRANTPKAMTDTADVWRLLLAFPALKSVRGDVASLLASLEANPQVTERWQQVVATTIEPEIEDDDY
jgi:hypothetical protein